MEDLTWKVELIKSGPPYGWLTHWGLCGKGFLLVAFFFPLFHLAIQSCRLRKQFGKPCRLVWLRSVNCLCSPPLGPLLGHSFLPSLPKSRPFCCQISEALTSVIILLFKKNSWKCFNFYLKLRLQQHPLYGHQFKIVQSPSYVSVTPLAWFIDHQP